MCCADLVSTAYAIRAISPDEAPDVVLATGAVAPPDAGQFAGCGNAGLAPAETPVATQMVEAGMLADATAVLAVDAMAAPADASEASEVRASADPVTTDSRAAMPADTVESVE
eukprot:870336-Alexandrium_andersonii.AAC.1